jgi:hypothetical protein
MYTIPAIFIKISTYSCCEKIISSGEMKMSFSSSLLGGRMEPEKSLAGKNLGNLARYPVVCHDHALSHRLVDGQVRLG